MNCIATGIFLGRLKALGNTNTPARTLPRNPHPNRHRPQRRQDLRNRRSLQRLGGNSPGRSQAVRGAGWCRVAEALGEAAAAGGKGQEASSAYCGAGALYWVGEVEETGGVALF